MILVERPLLGAHALVAAPGLGDQHHHRVGQRAAAHHQHLERVVQHGRIATALADDRKQVAHPLAEEVRLEQPLAGAHPVDVSAQRIDLAVVGQIAERMRQRPGRKGVGAEALVDERQGTLDRGVGDVGEVGLDLVGGEHALVDDRVGGEAPDVEIVLLLETAGEHPVLHPLPDQEQGPLELRRIAHRPAPADEHLADDRLVPPGALADGAVVGADVAPPQGDLPLLPHDAIEQRLAPDALVKIGRKRDHTDAIVLGRGEHDPKPRAFTSEEGVGQLEKNPGPVAGIRLAAAGPAMQQILQHRQRLADDAV